MTRPGKRERQAYRLNQSNSGTALDRNHSSALEKLHDSLHKARLSHNRISKPQPEKKQSAVEIQAIVELATKAAAEAAAKAVAETLTSLHTGGEPLQSVTFSPKSENCGKLDRSLFDRIQK
ncbi:hypothetical protein EDC01DRAFT_626479 [Geopyxis carbonaria]|nr:hypothetical protein EDC01DRAFT_626479 [Geopyxis carbonaria]